MAIRATSDSGTPLVATEPNSEHAAIYRAIAAKVAEKLKPRAAVS
jgi:ATP-binding protein involved in chromosome partitioning